MSAKQMIEESKGECRTPLTLFFFSRKYESKTNTIISQAQEEIYHTSVIRMES